MIIITFYINRNFLPRCAIPYVGEREYEIIKINRDFAAAAPATQLKTVKNRVSIKLFKDLGIFYSPCFSRLVKYVWFFFVWIYFCFILYLKYKTEHIFSYSPAVQWYERLVLLHKLVKHLAFTVLLYYTQILAPDIGFVREISWSRGAVSY